MIDRPRGWSAIAIAMIKSAESVEDLTGMEEGEKRVTVLRAFEARIAELTELADSENGEPTDDSETAEATEDGETTEDSEDTGE
jgi:hypothetical protein